MLKSFLFSILLLLSVSCNSASLSIPATEKVTLTSNNFVYINGVIDPSSMSKAGSELLELSSKLSVDEPIYLVINSPGGSIFAGLEFVQALRSVPQKVIGVCMFCASMAFHIFQNTTERYVLETGVLMQHRASGGFQGQFNLGEVESRLKYVTDVTNAMHLIESTRMGISLDDYNKLVKDEFWVYGVDNLKKRTADKVVTLVCSKELIEGKTEIVREQLLMGLFMVRQRVIVSNCPLITSETIIPEKKEEERNK